MKIMHVFDCLEAISHVRTVFSASKTWADVKKYSYNFYCSFLLYSDPSLNSFNGCIVNARYWVEIVLNINSCTKIHF